MVLTLMGVLRVAALAVVRVAALTLVRQTRVRAFWGSIHALYFLCHTIYLSACQAIATPRGLWPQELRRGCLVSSL